MRWNKPRQESGTLNDVNVTPLIDVSLVLVVILLLATPLAFESAFGLTRAEAAAREADAAREIICIELEIIDQQHVRVNREMIVLAELGPALRILLAGETTPQVTVACAGSVTHGVFVEVLDVAKASGATSIAVVGR